jgi:hypothetical protein
LLKIWAVNNLSGQNGSDGPENGDEENFPSISGGQKAPSDQ